MLNWLIYAGIMIYMEIVFHLGCYGFQGCNPILTIGFVGLITAVQAMISGAFPPKWQRLVFWLLIIPEYLVFVVQTVYYKIFRQPLQIGAALVTGQDALTNYWRETLTGILHALPLILLLALPLIVIAAVPIKGRKWYPVSMRGAQRIRLVIGGLSAMLYCVCSVFFGILLETNYSEDYMEFYDPDTVLRNMGVVTMVQRDGWYEISNLFSGNSVHFKKPSPEIVVAAGVNSQMPETETVETETGTEVTEATEQGPDTSPNVLNIDLKRLAELSEGSKEKTWLADYLAKLTPTKRNEYTGIFEDYNLIYLTAEGFSTYAVREDLTPTLYKMLHSSFVFNNYYVPLWQTSTSDGEYVNCIGLIPDGQHSMKKSASISLPFTLPRFFTKDGVYCRAYHNNSLSYYDRHLTHTNLGYDFKAAQLGSLSEAEWGDKIFPMEHPDAWPQSDYEMMQGTIPEYIDDDRFHVYYMTVSGHMVYNWVGNRMSSWHKSEVADLNLSENAKAYIACNMELDKAMEYLLEQLELAGKLENTVICLSADHYPYGLTDEEYNEIAGRDLSKDMDKYRNSLILWNAAMEEPVYVDKACCSVDLVPTLLNLFGYDYDSRLYAGRDIFSDEEGLVIFNDRSFVSDTVIYDKHRKTTNWKKDLSDEEQDAYMTEKQQDVKDRYQFSAYILRNDYYHMISQCMENRND